MSQYKKFGVIVYAFPEVPEEEVREKMLHVMSKQIMKAIEIKKGFYGPFGSIKYEGILRIKKEGEQHERSNQQTSGD